MKRSEAPALSLPDPEIERGVRWFAPRGCVVERDDGVREVLVGGTLLAALDEDDVATRNVVVVLLSEEPTMHLGRLAEAFQLSAERVRQLRRLYEREGLEGLTRPASLGRPRAYDERDLRRLEKMFEAGVSVDDALGRMKKGSRTSIVMARLDWRRRRAEEATKSAPAPAPEPRQVELPIELAAAAKLVVTSAANDSTPGAGASSRQGAELADQRGRGRSPESAPFVQHIGTWLLLGMLSRLGLHASMDAIGRGFVDRETLRVVVDAVVASLAIGEHCVEGVRRIETPTAGALLRSSGAPSPSFARALLTEFAEGHDGLAPIKLQSSMLAALARDAYVAAAEVPVFYVDNHLRPYTGQEVVRRGWRMQDKRVRPGITDYYVHDEQGRPMMRVDCPSHDSLSKWLMPIGETVRSFLRDEQRVLLAFDRGGAFPETLAELRDRQFDVVTYERKPYPELLESAFDQEVVIDDERLRFVDTRTNLGAGRGRLRRIAVRTEEGRQINLLSSSKLPAARLIELMRGRWCQENGFKYGVERWGINQLDDRKTKRVDPDEVIPNPARNRLDRALRAAYVREGDARRKLHALAEGDAKRARWEKEIADAQAAQKQLLAQRPTTPKKARVADTELADVLVRHEGRRKHVLDTVRIACANAESELAALLAEHLEREAEAKKVLSNVFKAPGRVRALKGSIVVELSVAANDSERESLNRFFVDLDRLRLTLPGDPSGRPLRFRSQMD
jgi:hypothetical protein